MDLRKLMVDTKSAWIPFPEGEGFEVEVASIARKELTKMRKGCTTTKFDRKNRSVPVEQIDEDKFIELFTEKTVLNWKGLTLGFLSTLMLINTKDHDLSTEVEFSPETAILLVKSSMEFDNWLNEVVFDLDNFRS